MEAGGRYRETVGKKEMTSQAHSPHTIKPSSPDVEDLGMVVCDNLDATAAILGDAVPLRIFLFAGSMDSR